MPYHLERAGGSLEIWEDGPPAKAVCMFSADPERASQLEALARLMCAQANMDEGGMLTLFDQEAT